MCVSANKDLLLDIDKWRTFEIEGAMRHICGCCCCLFADKKQSI